MTHNQSSWWWQCRWNRAGPSSIARLCVTRGSGGDPTVGRPGRGLEVIIINTITPIPTIRISLTIARKGNRWKKILSQTERVFRHGCHLEAPVSGLQLREGHRLVPPGQVQKTPDIIVTPESWPGLHLNWLHVKQISKIEHCRLQNTVTAHCCWRAALPPLRCRSV